MQMVKTGTWEQVYKVVQKVNTYNKKFKDNLTVELNECTDLQRRGFLNTGEFFKLSGITRRKISRDQIPIFTVIVTGTNIREI